MYATSEEEDSPVSVLLQHMEKHDDAELRRCGACGMKMWPRAIPRHPAVKNPGFPDQEMYPDQEMAHPSSIVKDETVLERRLAAALKTAGWSLRPADPPADFLAVKGARRYPVLFRRAQDAR